MADIRMCDGKGCRLKEKCYRHKAPANEFGQSYFSKTPFDHENNNCSKFWNVTS